MFFDNPKILSDPAFGGAGGEVHAFGSEGSSGEAGTQSAGASSSGDTTLYVGSLYEEHSADKTHFIFLGGTRIASVTNPSASGVGGKVLYYHADHLGGTNLLTDASGVVKELTEYEPYGSLSKHEKYGDDSGTAWYYFTGKPLDDETGLYYYGARYYNPVIGRFITPDTIVQSPGNPQTLNRYAYAGNNPVNHIDPSGHSFWKKLGSFFKKFGGTILSVAFTFVGMPFIGALISSAFSTFVNGGSFANFAIGFGVGMVAGWAGGNLGGGIGKFFDMNKAGLGLAALRGGLSGAIGGAGSAAIYKQNILKGALFGGLSGAAVGSAMWKMNDMRTNDFLKNNVEWRSGIEDQDIPKLEQAIKEAGQSPVGGRLMSRFIRSGAKLSIFGESMRSDGGTGPGTAQGTNDMYFNGDVQKNVGSIISGEPWGPSNDDATTFIHEMGHALNGYNYASEPLNIQHSENLYRAWTGAPARNDYGVLSQGQGSTPIPNRSIWDGFVQTY